MSQRGNRSLVVSAVAALALAAGCAQFSPTPRELIEARAAYDRAVAGDAARVVPEEVREAHRALAAAEEARARSAPEHEVADRAYVARRKIEAAEVNAAAALAAERRRRSELAMAQVAGAVADEARRDLIEERQRAEEAQRTAAEEQQRAEQARTEAELRTAEAARQAEQARTEAQQRAAEAEQARLAAAEAQQRAETERRAREEADAHARAAMAQLERIATVERTARGLIVTLPGGVLFRSGQAVLLDDARVRLEQVAAALKALPADQQPQIVVEGHTDSTGSAESNMLLSQRRADAVRDFLVRNGVPAERIVARGWGEERPRSGNARAEDRAMNRRVEIVIPNATGTTPAEPATSP